MPRDQVKPWRARLAASKGKEDISDNPVGSRARGLELDLRLREFEISQLTQRNNFFMIFQGVLIAGLVQSQGTAAPLITASMSLLGVATSIFQIGMAGGAKYWQSRWEASTRSSEIALVLELMKQRRLAVQTFTHDSELLTEEEKKKIKDWNDAHLEPKDQITDDTEFIQKVVESDIQLGRSCWLRKHADWWVRRFAIAPKWSVSRIPIWIGAMLLIFWLTIATHSIRFPAFDVASITPTWFELTPLKHDSIPK
jgi:hypothetical protein